MPQGAKYLRGPEQPTGPFGVIGVTRNTMDTLRPLARLSAMLLMATGLGHGATVLMAQDYSFTSGAIPLCDTSEFTATVNGLGPLVDPSWGMGGVYLDNLWMNITTDHPQTLQINLTSPMGTTLVLSAFNGAGGENYTDTHFGFYSSNSIAGAAAPFTGWWMPQGGSFNTFTGEDPNGVWTITVIDTACANGGQGPGGTWTPGWFNGGSGSGGFGFGNSSPPPPCTVDLGFYNEYICSGGAIDLTSMLDQGWGVPLVYYGPLGSAVADPTNVTEPGSYYADYYDWLNNCYFYGSVELIVQSQVDLGPDQSITVCDPSQAVDLTALFAHPWQYSSWSFEGIPISNGNAQGATEPGSYQLIGSNMAGCNDTALVTLSEGSISLGPDQVVSICPGASADLTTLYNTTGLSSSWSFGGQPFGSPGAATDPGLYTLEVDDGSGCPASAVVDLQLAPAPDLGPNGIVDLCSNGTVDLTTLYDLSAGSATWTLTGTPVWMPEAVNQEGTYQLVLTNGSDCSDTATVTVTIFDSPMLGPDQSMTMCAGEVVDLTELFDTQGLNATWTMGGAPVADPGVVDEGGTYRLVVSTVDNCRDTAFVNVILQAAPVLGADVELSVCAGATVDLSELVVSGTSTANWTLNGTAVPDPTAVDEAGTYQLVLTNGYGCSDTLLADVQLLPTPYLGPDVALGVCSGVPVDLNSAFPQVNGSLEWSLNGVPVDGPEDVTSSGIYQLVATFANGCTDLALLELTITPAPELGPDQTFTLCPWQTVDLSTVFPVADVTVTYTWNGAPVSDPTAIHEAGTYVISVTDANGCVDEAIALVMNMDCLCEADFVEDARCLQEPVQFTLVADSTVVSANWSFHGAAHASMEVDPLVRFTAEGEVKVTLEATLTCGVVVVERTIRAQDCTDSCSVWVPASFSPNNDGINDLWGGVTECAAKDYVIQVFDRWGELVFSATDPLQRWDGNSKGRQLGAGVYAYRVSYRLPYQENKKVAGSVTLLR